MQSQPEKVKPTNITRTWEVDLYGSWGDGPSATVYLGSHVVTLSADHNGNWSAIIDGENQGTIDRAVSYLNWAKADERIKLIREERIPPPFEFPVQIGKARAHTLHKIMGAAGVPHDQHYDLAAVAIGDPWPLESLALLTEKEAKLVWVHLCKVCPKARAIGQRLKAPQTHAA